MGNLGGPAAPGYAWESVPAQQYLEPAFSDSLPVVRPAKRRVPLLAKILIPLGAVVLAAVAGFGLMARDNAGGMTGYSGPDAVPAVIDSNQIVIPVSGTTGSWSVTITPTKGWDWQLDNDAATITTSTPDYGSLRIGVVQVPDSDWKQYAADTMAGYEATLDNATGPTSTAVGGLPAVEYTAQVGTTEYRYLFLADPEGEFVYTIFTEADQPGPKPSTSLDIQQMIDSFHRNW
ncbi:MAG: hypothetical protein LBI33_00090 [Propionibacteriaceae bacterium]|jgi:hypothetical protein|nr:hypothetical protein [Propionibacteriaceae bacterium]